MHHELSHASHHNKVGNGYWDGYVRYIANSLLDSDGDSSYGDGTGEYAGACQVGEMWGHAMGDIRMCERYQLPMNAPIHTELKTEKMVIG
jgi:hypothetical protein